MIHKAAMVLVLALVGALSWWFRETHSIALTLSAERDAVEEIAPGTPAGEVPAAEGDPSQDPPASTESEDSGLGAETWITAEPDGLYHVRRLHRAWTEGLPVAETDPYLNYPNGSRIPWPPYYTLFLKAVLAPRAPAVESELRGYLERGVATVPMVLGVANSLLATVAVASVAGPAAGLFAGAYQAMLMGSVSYSMRGVGDHHAWVAFLLTLLLMVLSAGLGRDALRRVPRAVEWGGASGLIAGLLVGSWVGALVYVIQVQLMFAVLLFLAHRHEWRALGWFGLSFHGFALAALFPAVWWSQWKTDSPWMLVNLSWIHLLFLAAGGAVFVPLCGKPLSSAMMRRYPYLVGVALTAVAALLFVLDAPPARAIEEAFAWVTRTDRFMSAIFESQPLFTYFDPIRWVGWGTFLIPVVWVVTLGVLVRRKDWRLLPWVVGAPLLAVQAVRQFRFADAFSVTMVVLLAVGGRWILLWLLRCFGFGPEDSTPRTPLAFRLVGGLVFALGAALAMQSSSLALTWNQSQSSAETLREIRERAFREMCHWIRRRTPKTGDYSIMAQWRYGHVIEWAADRPTVTTNFGSYVGVEGFQAMNEFFLTEDQEKLEQLLVDRRARYVLITSHTPGQLLAYRFGAQEDADRLFEMDQGKINLSEDWFRTLGMRLMYGGLDFFAATGNQVDPIRCLRLVHVSPTKDPVPPFEEFGQIPVGNLWEHVPGARLEAQAPPGTKLSIHLSLVYPKSKFTITYRDEAHADAEGRVTMRVPYNTTSRNGDGFLSSRPLWTLGIQSGTLAITEEDVIEGRTVPLK